MTDTKPQAKTLRGRLEALGQVKYDGTIVFALRDLTEFIESALADKDREIVALHNEIRGLNSDLGDYQGSIQERDRRIAELVKFHEGETDLYAQQIADLKAKLTQARLDEAKWRSEHWPALAKGEPALRWIKERQRENIERIAELERATGEGTK